MTSREKSPPPDVTDWEADPRPFSEIAKAWPKIHEKTRAWAAAELRASTETYDKWCDGRRTPTPEGTVRRLMTLIDRQHRPK